MTRRRAEAAERVALATTRLRDQALSAEDEDALYHTPETAIEAALSGVAPIVERDMPVWERRVKVCTMRNLGKSYDEIAEHFDMPRSRVLRDIREAYLEVMRDSLEDRVARQRVILLDMQAAIMPAALAADIDAQREVRAQLEQEAKLLGLNAPTRVAVGVSADDFASRMVSLAADMGWNLPAELTGASNDVPEFDEDVIDAEYDVPTPGMPEYDGPDPAPEYEDTPRGDADGVPPVSDVAV